VDAELANGADLFGRMTYVEDDGVEGLWSALGVSFAAGPQTEAYGLFRHLEAFGTDSDLTELAAGVAHGFGSARLPLTGHAELGVVREGADDGLATLRVGVSTRTTVGGATVDLGASIARTWIEGSRVETVDRFELTVAVPFGETGAANAAYQSFFDDARSMRSYLQGAQDFISPRGILFGGR
jgi:hypothetical protein